MSGEEGKTNDAVRGSSQPAELCHLLSGWRCSAPEQPSAPRSRPILLSTAKSSPSPGDPAAPGTCTPGKESQEFAPTLGRAMRNHGSSCNLPGKLSCLWPPAGSQPAGFKKDQSTAEVSAGPGFIQGKTFRISKAAWTTYQRRRGTAAAPAGRVLCDKGAHQRSGKRFHMYFKNLEKKGS